MAAFTTRWRLILGTLAIVLAWGVAAPNGLLLAVGLLSAFGCFVAMVQHALESPPERRRAGR